MTTGRSENVSALLTALRDMAALVAEHRAAFDRDRRLPDPVFAALADAGLFRLWLPSALGGAELSPVAFMQVVEAAAALDGSVGWLVGNGGAMSRVGGYLDPGVVEPWFASRRTFVVAATGSIGTARVVEGGYRVSGAWRFGSGAHHATWFMALCREAGEGLPADLPPICCYLPAEAVARTDRWHVSGLRGSGSSDFEVDDVFVPAQHCHAFYDPPPTQPGTLYRLPHLQLFQWSVSVVPLGIARAALGYAVGIAQGKGRAGNPALLAERELIQSEFGQLDAQRRAARAFLLEAMEALAEAVPAGGEPLLQAKATFRQACAFAADSAVRVVDGVTRAIGAASLFESSPLERCLRDVQAAAKHVAMSPGNYVIAGRVALGLHPLNAWF